jgi:hypothetical protein
MPKKNIDPEVIGPGNNGKNGNGQFITPMDIWDAEYNPPPSQSNISQIYHMPKPKEDLVGNFVRGVMKDQTQADALAVLGWMATDVGDESVMNLVGLKLASTVGIGGVGRAEALMGGIGVIAPDIYRVARNMPRKDNEKIDKPNRSSDFRDQENVRETRQS